MIGLRTALLPTVTVVALAACSTTSTGTTTPSATTSQSTGGTITVLAAASLTKSFGILGTTFEKDHPGTTVTLSFGASSALATQIGQGVPADVFASASTTNMDSVSKAGLASTAKPFAKNVMEIAVPASNPAHITALADLGKPGVKVALCQVEVPCGATAAKVFDNAQLTVTPVTQEADVKATLAKVTLGEVDAAVVYVTDVQDAGDKVKGIEIPAGVNASTAYPIAVLKSSKNTVTAQAFVDYVLSAQGQKVLADTGFAAP
ncbi:MAG: molybdate ABC transporter substrate-binding protein [Dermatophilaceae bacterium]